MLSISGAEETQDVTADMMHWGLRTPQNFHINARIETADTSPRFRDSWELRRCLIPANGFYEWYTDGVTKKPYYIYPTDLRPLFLAVLWYPTQNRSALALHHPDDRGHPCRPEVHTRMPVMIPYAQRDLLAQQQAVQNQRPRPHKLHPTEQTHRLKTNQQRAK